ncbi:MAG: hypothetical protein AAGC95_14120 [Pseudomonadota bacterium]
MDTANEAYVEQDIAPGDRYKDYKTRRVSGLAKFANAMYFARLHALRADNARRRSRINWGRLIICIIVALGILVVSGATGPSALDAGALTLFYLFTVGIAYASIAIVFNNWRHGRRRARLDAVLTDLTRVVSEETTHVSQASARVRQWMTASVAKSLKPAVRARAEAAWLYAENKELLQSIDIVIENPRSDTPAEVKTFRERRKLWDIAIASFIAFSIGFVPFTAFPWFIETALPWFSAQMQALVGSTEPNTEAQEADSGFYILGLIVFAFFALPWALFAAFPGGPQADGLYDGALGKLQQAVQNARGMVLGLLSRDLRTAAETLSARIDDLAEKARRYEDGDSAESQPMGPPHQTLARTGAETEAQPHDPLAPKFAFAPPVFRADTPTGKSSKIKGKRPGRRRR